MNDETTDNSANDNIDEKTYPVSKKKKTIELLGKANEARESVTTVADTANNVLSTIKWVAIAICLGLAVFTGFSVYKLVTAPARAVSNAAETVTDTVKSGASSVRDGASDILNRLVIPASHQAKLNSAANAAFGAVSNMKASEPETMTQRVFWTANFVGNENKVCELSMSFGGDNIPVFIAADNKGYATSKSLGSKNDRLMRILIRADGDDLGLNAEWDQEASAWVMKWKATTIKKTLGDGDAEQRILDVLAMAAKTCK